MNSNIESQPHVIVRLWQDVLFATLHIPATRNALAPGVVAELARAIDWATTDTSVRALVLRGSNGFFSAGGNVGNFQARLDTHETDEDPVAARNREFGRFMQRLNTLPIPVIAAVEGAAMGGGMGLACAADIVLATHSARFALSETSLGIIPAQIAPFVVARLGQRVACRLGLSGEKISGETAQLLGMVDALAPDGPALDELLAQWLSRIATCAPGANRALKPLLRRCGHDNNEDLLDDAARQFSACMRAEGAEGIAAFRAKRLTSWQRTFSADDIRAAQLVPAHGSTSTGSN
ncbi:enoyl-CoA hydratase-related protein [Comamonas humi]